MDLDNVRFRAVMEECRALSGDLGMEAEFREVAVRLHDRAARIGERYGTEQEKAKLLEEMESFVSSHKERILREGDQSKSA